MIKEKMVPVAVPNQVPPKLRYCLYARKSTESEERQILSIDSQIKEMLELAEREGFEIAEIRRESHSAKDTGQRPVFNELLKDIRSGKFNAILTWAPDRLSRNAGDLGAIVDLMDQKLVVEIRTYGQRFVNSPNEKFLLMILGSQAKLENDNRGINVKRGLRASVEMGLWPGVAPTGYLNEMRKDRKGHVMVDPKRGSVIRQLFEKVAQENWSGRQLHLWLNEIKFTTRSGKPLSLSNIYLVLKNSFYCGRFEYPRGSDSWYKGRHDPLVSQELYDKVQERLTRDGIERSDRKEFAFTKLIRCGLCDSGVTADEKFKKLADGSIARYVYYGCTKGKDLNCKAGYVREEELLAQLLKILDEVSMDEIGMRTQIEGEIERYRRFRHGVLGIKGAAERQDQGIDVRNYAKYLLANGTTFEKRELLSCLRSRLSLKEKKLSLAIVS